MAPHLASNPHEEAARLKKAVNLANYINATFRDVLDEDFLGLAELPETWWMAVAARAGCKPPSDRTIAQVISLLRQQGLSRTPPASDAEVPAGSAAPHPAGASSAEVRQLYMERFGSAGIR